jgi:Domain of unknown function (DUF1707)
MSSSPDPNLRASDADRDRVAELLRRHVADGRLTMEEFHTRLDACLAAKTYGELDALVADLPSPSRYDDLPVPASSMTAASSKLPAQLGFDAWRAAVGSYITANLVCWVIWVVSGGGYPWPLWVTGPWGAVLLGRAISGHGPDGDRQRRRR